MTRPQIIRADTIDLQDPQAPSAQDHSRPPHRPNPHGGGPSPHQADALRHAEEEAADEQQRSPRVSWGHDEMQLDGHAPEDAGTAGILASHGAADAPSTLDDSAAGHDGGHGDSPAEEGEMADADEEDGEDDDLMDKISSSPSIDDGGYHPSFVWPVEAVSPSATLASTPSCSSSSSCPPSYRSRSPSPFVIARSPQPSVSHQHQEEDTSRGHRRHRHLHRYDLHPHHLPAGGHSRGLGNLGNVDHDSVMVDLNDRQMSGGSAQPKARNDEGIGEEENGIQTSPGDLDLAGLEDLLLPRYDPLLDGIPQIREPALPVLSTAPILSTPMRPVPAVPVEDGDVDHEDDDDDDARKKADDDSLPTVPRFADSGLGGECLQDAEDINFDFVYALHGFPATVDGQANASKGDTMVLLDDRNSYWWLVRIVKDSSIGYLPAEYIETPTERLARLNKHRNIDLSAPMLGDNPEKSKNSLKKAMRRRNTKTVQFSAPTYHEASEIEYSSDEEEQDASGHQDDGVDAESAEADDDTANNHADEITAVEPLRVKSHKSDLESETSDERSKTPESKDVDDHLSNNNNDDHPMAKDGSGDRQVDATSKSRHGIVRNTDSFFKDDNGETRKITLTPNLLRDDSSGASRSVESKELKTKGSLELLDKGHPSPEKSKEESKKKKEKKPGMLSGLFRRKDKKSRTQEEEVDDLSSSDKRSAESLRDSPVPKGSEESSRSDGHNGPAGSQQQAPQAPQAVQQTALPTKEQHNKLQKKSRVENPLAAKDQPTVGFLTARAEKSSPAQPQAPNRPAPSVQAIASSVRAVHEPTEPESGVQSLVPARVRSPEGILVKSPVGVRVKSPEGVRAKTPEGVRAKTPEGVRAKTPESVRVKTPEGARIQSPDGQQLAPSHMAGQMTMMGGQEALFKIGGSEKALQASLATSMGNQSRYDNMGRAEKPAVERQMMESLEGNGKVSRGQIHGREGLVDVGRLSESPVQIAFPDEGSRTARGLPSSSSSDTMASGTAANISSRHGGQSTPSSSSPEMIEAPEAHESRGHEHGQEEGGPVSLSSSSSPVSPSPPTTSSSSSGRTKTPTPQWNDEALRAYLETSDQEVRDLLIRVHDTTGVKPLPLDHPLIAPLQREKERVAEMSTRLDNLLTGWIARKQAARSGAPPDPTGAPPRYRMMGPEDFGL